MSLDLTDAIISSNKEKANNQSCPHRSVNTVRKVQVFPRRKQTAALFLPS
jgi:hypothetical protein